MGIVAGRAGMASLDEEYRLRAAQDHDIRDQMAALYAWARHPHAQVGELGVRTGNSTAALLAGVARSGGHLTSVDITSPQVPGWWHSLPFWDFILGDDTDPGITSLMPDGLDVLLVDTLHEYGHLLRELAAYVPKVRPGGVVLVHDTSPGPYGWWPDVPKALDTWTQENGLAWYNHPGWHGLGVIEIPGG